MENQAKNFMYIIIGIGVMGFLLFAGMGLYNYLS